MSDKELIKQEIERRIENLKISLDKNCVTEESKLDIRGNITTLYGLLKFIDSLPEESGCEANCTTKSEDLEEAAVEAFKKIVDSGNNSFLEIFKAGSEWQKQQMKDALQTEYEKGLFDMREKMMKTLIGGEIVKDIHNQLSVKSEPLNDAFGRFGDKVKIIIVKED